MDQTFGKEYKLCSQKKIESLFKTGNLVKKFPLIVHFQEVEETLSKPFQVVISVPKRIYRKAHDRNRIKRLMREAVRKNKNILESYLIPKNKNIIPGYIFYGNTVKKIKKNILGLKRNNINSDLLKKENIRFKKLLKFRK